MKKIIYSIAFAMMFCNAYAQQKLNRGNAPIEKDITDLKVGDAVPNFKLGKIFNDEKRSAWISDYSDRLLILDFGDTGCSGCILALPEMDKLQKAFGEKIKIFWVTWEEEPSIKTFWANGGRFTKNNNLATVVEDSTARAYFKNRGIPHEVWIYKGKVIAITGPEYVDDANIKKVLSGTTIKWPVKYDYFTFDPGTQALFTLSPGQVNSGTFVSYTAIGNYREAVSSFAPGNGIERDTVKKSVRVYIANRSIFEIYRAKWSKMHKTSPLPTENQIVWEVADQFRYRYNKQYGYHEEWIRKHGICFESVSPDQGQTDMELAKTTITDLDRLLGLNVRWEKRKEKVLVLTRTNTQDKFFSPDIITEENITDFTSVVAIANGINGLANNPYVVDETNYKGDGYIKASITNWSDIAAIQKAIAPYGLVLKEAERLVDKFVFSEMKKP